MGQQLFIRAEAVIRVLVDVDDGLGALRSSVAGHRHPGAAAASGINEEDAKKLTA